MLIVDGDWVIRLETHYAAVLHKHAWHTVYGCRNDKFIIEADTLCIRSDLFVEICPSFRSQSQMPLANGTGGVSCIFQHIRHSDTGSINDKFRVAGSDTCVLLTPGIHTREEPKTGRSAGGGSCVSIRELHALSGQTVDIGCAHFGCSVATQITDTKIVGEYVNNVRLLVVLSVTLLSGIITS